jgi:hypothetical protein
MGRGVERWPFGLELMAERQKSDGRVAERRGNAKNMRGEKEKSQGHVFVASYEACHPE